MAKNILICSRPGVGKTQKAIEYYIDKIASGKNGIYFNFEMSDEALMDRILQTCCDKKIQMSLGGIRNLYLDTTSNSFDKIIEYILNNQDEQFNFIIVDYLQLLGNERNYKTFFDFTKKNNLEVIITSQLSRGVEIPYKAWTDLVQGLREKDYGILDFIDEVTFITKSYGIICVDNSNKSL